MGGYRRSGADGWVRHPGGPGGFTLLFTGAGLAVIAVVLIVGGYLSAVSSGSTADDSAKRTADALETIAKTLKTISGAPPDARNLSVTVRLDENQWKDIRDAAVEARVVVEGVAGKAARIAAAVEKAAEGSYYPRPWACSHPYCMGAVHFPHDWPLEPETDLACSNITKPPNIPLPVIHDLGKVIGKLIKNLKTSSTNKSIIIVGHASTDGSPTYNETLSKRRAKFVECYLKEHQDLKELIADIEFELHSMGEEASTNSLRHPDSWYRVVQVFLVDSAIASIRCCEEARHTFHPCQL